MTQNKTPGPPVSESESPVDQQTVKLVSTAKRQWERTFDAISEPIMVIDHGYTIRRANLALAHELNMPIQQVVGRTCHELRAGSDRAFARQPSGVCLGCPAVRVHETGVGPHEAEISTRSGRLYRLRVYPLEDDSTALTVCRYRDVTEERALNRQLSNAEKLAAIGRLAGGVAHEINNPLGGILAFTQILLRDELDLDERSEYLREIEKSALRCKAIVESLLRFARQSSITQRGPLSLNDVVREALRFVQYKFEVRDVPIQQRLDPALPQMVGNANQIEQVLVNLLSNAFDAVASKGASEGNMVEIATGSQDGRVVLEVSDTGTGVQPDVLEKVFDPFFTTKDEGKGTGLGLAVTYAIVQEHGGRISVANRPEGGAVFRVSFPTAADRVAEE